MLFRTGPALTGNSDLESNSTLSISQYCRELYLVSGFYPTTPNSRPISLKFLTSASICSLECSQVTVRRRRAEKRFWKVWVCF